MVRWGYWVGTGVVVAALAVQMARPVGAASLTTTVKAPGIGSKLQMDWPSGPESYVALSPGGEVGAKGPDQEIPVGSVTKMMTAFLLLKKYPLAFGSQGPSVTVTAHDVKEYHQDLAGHQSVAKVTLGEKLSEKKILEGLLVASGNNIAHIAADWVSGSSAAFTKMMNQEARKLGMHHTLFVGPSGLNPGNVSTPRDETILAEKAMQIPVFRAIVAMPEVSWGHSHRAIENFNYVVGHDGISGVKTGSTVAAGGCFVFSAPRTVGSHVVTIYGAVLGQAGTPELPQLQYALNDGESLINQLSAQLKSVYLVRSGQSVAKVSAPWTHPVSLASEKTVSAVLWPGERVKETVQFTGGSRGHLLIEAGSSHWSVPVKLSSALPKPGLLYRLTRGL
ncbi:MAG: D-alanyl-D-alanine carboxypeptidase [Firmicutes bacterium]|uniref:D-alanyl-D-alanine carboxypeptidase n=1 Tax=Sulfobacillus benefaciens TaxID=453960 RepID=A0A2T2WSW8_9FIRM|nr:D-alanyl-D-alanine carboxypeptidase [Bacillota bacterium]MCL5012463.1 D-alanyl-D-alanine carboxypeptidase [Bacillota bacterium]PSR25341.1 MAG: D-alanyl-D-alanine carboxypeptidase [Sulfobacillus benefaciens]